MFDKCNQFLFKNQVLCIGFYVAVICLNIFVFIILLGFKTKSFMPMQIPLYKIFHSLAMTIQNLFGSLVLFIFCNHIKFEKLNGKILFEFLFKYGIATQFIAPLILIQSQYELIIYLIYPKITKCLKNTTLYFYICMIPYFLGFFIVKKSYKLKYHEIMYFGISIGVFGLFSTIILLYLLHHKHLIQCNLSLKSEKILSCYILFSTTITIIWFIPSLVILMMHFESFSLSNINHQNDIYLSYIPIISQFFVPFINFIIVSSSLYHKIDI